MAIQPPIIDTYAALAHKTPMGSPTTVPQSVAPSWIPNEDRRRLNAYTLLSAYLNNVSRFMIDAPSKGEDTRKERREYGDPSMLVGRIVAGILGDDAQIVVEGTNEPIPDEPPIPEEPQMPSTPEGTSEFMNDMQRQIFEARHDVWEEQAQEILDHWLQTFNDRPNLIGRQEWLRQWAEDEGYYAKVWEREEDSVGLGDGVFVYSWSSASNRPIVDVYDPGFYFPVLTDQTRGFPTKIHLAWEYEENDRKFLRRITYRLGHIQPELDGDGLPLLNDETGAVVLRQGDVLTDTGIVRRYAWRTEASNVTCYKSDMVWEVQRTPTDWDDLDESKAIVMFNEDGMPMRDLDLMIDFIPVLHVPNTPTGKNHFGKSSLLLVSQLLDDLQGVDTDLRKAAALAAGPVIGLASTQMAGDLTLRQGRIFNLGANGHMDVLNLSEGLRELRQYMDESLLNRLSVNINLPAELIGRARVADAASGFAILLAFGPYTQMVRILRLVRLNKDRIGLEFVQRLAQAGGVLPPGENPPAYLMPGAHLPSDRATQVELVVKLLQERGVSRKTALQMLVDVGIDVGDLAAELQRIEREDTAAAVEVRDATDSAELAANRLGLVIPEPIVPDPPPPPTNDPPPPPGPDPVDPDLDPTGA